MTSGAFAQWQPLYAARGVPTFPVRGKTPVVPGYLHVGVGASRSLAGRYAAFDAFGFAPRRAGLVVLDVDCADERILADALDRHGPTPFVVRSGSGNFQAWYRRTNEGRLIKPDPALPIDILGDGFVVAPPSKSAKGFYAIIAGSLEDLPRLPFLQNAPLGRSRPAEASDTGEGHRNDTLWQRCMQQARHCDDFDALMDVARTINSGFGLPLDDAEVIKTARSAWGYTERGENRIGRRVVVAAHAEVDDLMDRHPDAFILLMFLRRHNWSNDFLVANGLAESMPGGGWTRKRLAAARTRLIEHGLLVETRAASKARGPALYRFKGGQY